MRKLLAIGLPSLVAAVGLSVYLGLANHPVDVSQTPYSHKANLIRLQMQHNKDSGGKGYTASIASASSAPSIVTPNPHLVATARIPPVSPAAWDQFNLWSIAFTDNVNWTVEAGNKASSPSTGVLVVINLKSNLRTNVITVPHAGLVEITGFDAATLHLKSNLGVGEYDLRSDSVTWN